MKLADIVKEALLQLGENGTHKVMVGMNHAQDLWRTLNMDVMRGIHTERLEVTDLRTIDFPSDYVEYKKLAVCIPGGILRSLGKSDRMCMITTDDCGDELPVDGGDPRGIPPDLVDAEDYYYYWTFNDYGGQYGRGAGYAQEGYFREDRENKRFQLSSAVTGTHIVLEYITTGLVAYKDTEVHEFAVQAVKEYVKWKMCEGKNSKRQASEQYEQNYWREYRNLRKRNNRGDLDEIMTALRRGFKASARN